MLQEKSRIIKIIVPLRMFLGVRYKPLKEEQLFIVSNLIEFHFFAKRKEGYPD